VALATALEFASGTLLVTALEFASGTYRDYLHTRNCTRIR